MTSVIYPLRNQIQKGMVAVLENVIELINISGGGDCELSNYGNMRDVINPFDYKFKPGVYTNHRL